MEAKKLTEFLRQKEQRQKAVDWDTVRKKWLKSLEALGKMLAKWLQEPISQNLLKIERTDDVTLVEDDLGTYSAPRWIIRAGRDQIVVTPVGRVIIGGQGRVDLDHGPRKVMLIQTGPGAWKLRWSHVDRAMHDANEQTFSDAIKQLLE